MTVTVLKRIMRVRISCYYPTDGIHGAARLEYLYVLCHTKIKASEKITEGHDHQWTGRDGNGLG